MKTILTTLLLVLMTIAVNAQLVDDFTTGNLNTTKFSAGESDKLFQKGANIIGKIRRVNYKVGDNPFNHTPQVSIKNGTLASSVGFDVNTTIYLSYGYDQQGAKPLNLDVSDKKSLKIEFIAKSSVNGIYVTLLTHSDRGVYSKHVTEREGKMILDIPLSEIRKIGERFTLSKIDHIRIQLDSRSKTGCNMAINKIWFE